MSDLWFLLFYGGSFGVVLFLSAFLPYLSRKTECFGVGIPEEIYDHPALVRLRCQYRNRALGAGLLVGIVMGTVFIMGAISHEDLGNYGMAVLLIIDFLWYLWGRRRVLRLKAASDWGAKRPARVMVETNFRRRRIAVSPRWFVGFAIIIAATVLLGFRHYERLPGEIPLFFNTWDGRMLRKSPRILWVIPCLQLVLTGMTFLLYRLIERARQEVDPADPEHSLEQNRVFRYRWSGFSIGVGLLMTVLLGSPLIMGQTGLRFTGVMNIVVMVLISIWALWLVITTGQGGSRLGRGKNTCAGGAMQRDEDRFWILGLIYINPKDPALIVERRFGIGWTFNMGRLETWGMMAAVAVVVFLIQWLVKG